jgi:hypothetical protein
MVVAAAVSQDPTEQLVVRLAVVAPVVPVLQLL